MKVIMVCEVWSLKCARSVFFVLLLSKIVICSFHGKKDENMDKPLLSSNDSDRHGLVSQSIVKGQKPHVKMKNQIPHKIRTSSKIPKWFDNILTSYRTRNSQPKMHIDLQSQEEVSLPLKVSESSNSNRAKLQQFMSQTSFHDQRKSGIIYTFYHNLYPSKRRKRSVPETSISSGEKELNNSENRKPKLWSQVSQDVRVTREGVDKSVNKRTESPSSVNSLQEPIYRPTLPFEWTPEGNYSAAWKIWKKYKAEKAIEREAQIAFMCTVFLLCLLSWAVWCTGMCNRKKIHYREWNFQQSHATVTMADVLRRRWKYLPEESFYEEIIVHDRGTDP